VLRCPEPFNNEEVYKTLKLWSLNGQTKDALAKTQGAGWKYDIVYPGFKMNMPDLVCGDWTRAVTKVSDCYFT
jgi:dTDP-4-amino-4,6-dideoxygalactose transaminase